MGVKREVFIHKEIAPCCAVVLKSAVRGPESQHFRARQEAEHVLPDSSRHKHQAKVVHLPPPPFRPSYSFVDLVNDKKR